MNALLATPFDKNKRTLPLKVTFSAKKGILLYIRLHSSPYFCYDMDPSSDTSLDGPIASFLESYLKRERKSPFLPVDFSSFSPFYVAVLQAIQTVPFGETVSYKDIAISIGKGKACRAIGKVCHDNPYPLLIPCHRIIHSSGKVGGFAYTSSLKIKMLAFENAPYKK